MLSKEEEIEILNIFGGHREGTRYVFNFEEDNSFRKGGIVGEIGETIDIDYEDVTQKRLC